MNTFSQDIYCWNSSSWTHAHFILAIKAHDKQVQPFINMEPLVPPPLKVPQIYISLISRWAIMGDHEFEYYGQNYNEINCTAGEKLPSPSIPNPDITQNITFPPIFWPDPYPVWEVALKITLYTVAMAMAIIGNLLVLFTIVYVKKMHNSTFLYIG